MLVAEKTDFEINEKTEKYEKQQENQ